MRIAVVHSFYKSDKPSGENVVVADQVEALTRAGHEVRLFAKYTDNEATQALYPLKAAIRTAGQRGADPQGLGSFGPDIVHVHNLFPNWGAQWLKKYRGKIVVTLHNYRTLCSAGILWRDGHDCTECLEQGSRRAIVHGCYRGSRVATVPLAWASRGQGRHQIHLMLASSLVVLNTYAERVFRARLPGPIHVIPNFARVDGQPPAEREGLIFVGRLSAEKGVLRLLEQSTRDLPLTIIGDGPLMSDVQALTANRPWVTVKGPASRSEVISALQTARGLVVPSLCMEGVPTVALEALNCGTPLLISDYCTAAEELTKGGAGLVYSPDDSKAILEAWKGLTQDRDQFTKRALQLGKSTYSEEAWLLAITDVYQEVLLANREMR